MQAFRIFLVVLIVVLVGYTAAVGLQHGWNLLPVFFSSIAELGWHGQFNLDFLTYLALSAIWVSWRHRFSGAGLVLGVLAFFGGMLFLAPYLLWASFRCGGDIEAVLTGSSQPARQ